MRFAVVTPVRNGAAYVAETISSVIAQSDLLSGVSELDYVVMDGASTDDTVEIARATGGNKIRVVSRPDNGMYDALASGFQLVDGDWYCYLNAGDLLSPQAFEIIRLAAGATRSNWICGLHAYLSASGTVVHTRLPFNYSADLLRAGAYGRGLPTVQQESTFWSRNLMNEVDLDLLRSFSLAGDALLWHSFARIEEPAIIEAVLGAFRYHGGHLSNSEVTYVAELERISGPLTPMTRARIASQRGGWELPARAKARLNPRLYLYKPGIDRWQNREGMGFSLGRG